MRNRLTTLSLAVALGSGLLLSGGPSHGQTSPELTKKVLQMERDREKEFEDYFGEDLASVSKTADARLSFDGFKTTVFPAAIAPAKGTRLSMKGKFQLEHTNAHPNGCFSVH